MTTRESFSSCCLWSCGETRASLERSVQLNEAWRALRDPVKRAEYLLSLHGIEVAEIAPEVRFVGAHPVAGTEKSGAVAAMRDLFRGRKCILTPHRNECPGNQPPDRSHP